MKKNVIAAAVAAALFAPVAMAEVSISGGLQAEIMNMSGDGAVEGLYMGDAAEGASEDTGNYGFLKFSASEDLGDGMKALAVYNMNAAIADGGAARTGGREAYVGLSAGFGTVLAGVLSSPYKSSTVGWDPMLATALQARGSVGMSTHHNGYVSNALAYANTFGSAKVVAAVVLDEASGGTTGCTAGETCGNHAFSASVNVPVGPVELAVAHINMDSYGADDGADNNATKVGVKWVSGDITVAGQYEMLGVGDLDQTIAYVTASYAMGNNTISAAYGQADLDVSGVDNPTYAMVALNHKFSKSTNAFVGYRSNTFDSALDMDMSVLTAGMRVNF